MNAFRLRLIAIGTMVIDHVGYYLLQNAVLFRIVGRLTFPVFAFLIYNGFTHTRSVRRYGLRLLLFALISQIPYHLISASMGGTIGLNIFFTLFLGLVCLVIYHRFRHPAVYVVLISLFILAELLRVDYGWRGVCCIWLFTFLPRSPRLTYLAIAGLFWLPSLWFWFQGKAMLDLGVFSVLAFILIHAYNNQPGPKSFRNLFYWFYPVHLLLLFGVKIFLRN